MLVDDSISRGGSIMASSAPGERGGHISLLDLPMERDGREPCPPLGPYTGSRSSHTHSSRPIASSAAAIFTPRNHWHPFCCCCCSGRHLHCTAPQPGRW